jgi:hypothetical protein
MRPPIVLLYFIPLINSESVNVSFSEMWRGVYSTGEHTMFECLNFNFTPSMMSWQVDPLLDNDWEISNYITVIAK